MTEFIILGFLNHRDMTGYDIKQQMSLSTTHFIDSSYGSIYPALKRLEQKGLVYSKEINNGEKVKKLYSITEEGKKEFMIWLSSPIEASKSSIASALSKVFFFDFLPKEKAAELIKTYIEDIGKFKDNLVALKAEVDDKASPFELSTLDFGLDFYDFIIKWYENYLKHSQRN